MMQGCVFNFLQISLCSLSTVGLFEKSGYSVQAVFVVTIAAH